MVLPQEEEAASIFVKPVVLFLPILFSEASAVAANIVLQAVEFAKILLVLSPKTTLPSSSAQEAEELA